MSALFIKGKTLWAWNHLHDGHFAGISLFKRIVKCDKNTSYHLAISADNRYTLFLAGKVVTFADKMLYQFDGSFAGVYFWQSSSIITAEPFTPEFELKAESEKDFNIVIKKY